MGEESDGDKWPYGQFRGDLLFFAADSASLKGIKNKKKERAISRILYPRKGAMII